MEISHRYDDIIDLPHHVSEHRPQMPLIDRAVQFSPFAALTGYEAAIAETARLTDGKRELSEERKQELSLQLSRLQTRLGTDPDVTVIFFEADTRKSGGAYRSVTGRVKKIDSGLSLLELADGTVIPFDDILDLTFPDTEGAAYEKAPV